MITVFSPQMAEKGTAIRIFTLPIYDSGLIRPDTLADDSSSSASGGC